MPTARTTSASTSAARPSAIGKTRRRLAGIENAHARGAGERAELRIVTDERVEPAPDLELALDRRPQPSLPFVRQAAAGRCDADQ